MIIERFVSIFAVSAFLIGVIATSNVDAMGVGGILQDHEERINTLETNDAAQDTQLGKHENKIGDLETNDATQDSQLDEHKTSITDLEQQIDELEARLEAIQSQGPVMVNDADGHELGILLGHTGSPVQGSTVQVFIPEMKLAACIEKSTGYFCLPSEHSGSTAWESSDCSGTAYTTGYSDGTDLMGQRHSARDGPYEFFIVEEPPVTGITVYSEWDIDTLGCAPIPDGEERTVVWRMIEIKRDEIPFPNVPVRTPLQYVHQE